MGKITKTKMKFCSTILIVAVFKAPFVTAFVPNYSRGVVSSVPGVGFSSSSCSRTCSCPACSSSALKIVVGDTKAEFAARVDATFEKAIPRDLDFEAIVQKNFKGAISNQELVTSAVRLLAAK